MLLFSRKSGKHVRLDEKLFNKEEEQTALNKEVQKQIESQPKIPRVNHYTEARKHKWQVGMQVNAVFL